MPSRPNLVFFFCVVEGGTLRLKKTRWTWKKKVDLRSFKWVLSKIGDLQLIRPPGARGICIAGLHVRELQEWWGLSFMLYARETDWPDWLSEVAIKKRFWDNVTTNPNKKSGREIQGHGVSSSVTLFFTTGIFVGKSREQKTKKQVLHFLARQKLDTI